MSYKELRQEIEALQVQLTPAFIEDAVRTLMRQDEALKNGVSIRRLIKHLLGNPQMQDVEAVRAYVQLEPAFRAVFEQISSLTYFEGG